MKNTEENSGKETKSSSGNASAAGNSAVGADAGGGELISPPPRGSRRYGQRMGDMSGSESRQVIWMITFTDVMGLMLTFFVMLFAMTEPASDQWQDVSSALHNEFNQMRGSPLSRGPSDEINLARIDYDRALDIGYLTALLESVLSENETLRTARLLRQPGKLIISMPQELLFRPGDAAVTEEGSRALYLLGGSLSRIKNKIQISGYADPRPVHKDAEAQYESNWDLSLARAAGVAGVLNSVGYEQNIDILGYGAGRYDDLSAIPDEAVRMNLSRRVDIILLNHDGRKKELPFDAAAP